MDEQNIHLQFTAAQLDYMFRVLGRCPADEVEALRQSIRQQIMLANLPPNAEGPKAEAVGPLNGSGAVVVPPLAQ